MRTLLALSEGVRRTAYWNLAPEYRTWTVTSQAGQIRLPVFVTPLFVEPSGHS